MTLKDWLPSDANLYSGGKQEELLLNFLDINVTEDHKNDNCPHPFSHRHILAWCILENGIVVGWNENPSTGYSFPWKKHKNK